MAHQYLEKLDMLPQHMRRGMQDWIEHGQASYPGGFLSALLSNDLMGALGKADDVNAHALPLYAAYLYNYAPSGCFGSPRAFSEWQGLNAVADAA
jgi:hypothetical protein